MRRVVNRAAALAAVLAVACVVPGSTGARAEGAHAEGAHAEAAYAWRCDPEPWSYGAVIARKRPGGSYRIGPQRFCAEVADERRVPLGPIGIVIDPRAERAPARPLPVPPIPLRASPGPSLHRR